MANSYVKTENRKHRYATRAVTYYVQRISEPMDSEAREYRSIARMAEELRIPENTIRTFAKSGRQSQYVYARDGVLWMLHAPKKDVAITARAADDDMQDIGYQEFTSAYQLVRRFKVSFSTVAKLKASVPIGTECTQTINDEFRRKWYLTFQK